MAIAYDTFTSVAAGTGDLTWNHTGAASNVKGALVLVCGGSGNDVVDGVTYGGVAMSEVALSPLLKATGETGDIYGYFLGSSVPQGTQEIIVDVNAAGTKQAGCYTVTAAQDASVVDTTTISQDSGANPSGTLSLGGISCFCAEAFLSGLADVVASCTPPTGWTTSLETDAGAKGFCWYKYDTIGTADVTIGYTATTDDCVLLGVAIRENAAGGATQPPRSMHQFRLHNNS
jgi:hypothetical protein